MPGNPDQPRGKDGRWIKGSSGIAGTALVAGLVMSAGGGGTAATVGTSAESAAVQRATQAKNTRSSQNAAKKGDEGKAWSRMRLKKLKKEVNRDLPCVAQSYGEVQEFFLRHPCKKMQQRLFPLTDPEGNVIAVSIMWVSMPSRSDAARLKRIEDKYGTGDVIPVATQLLGYGGLRFTGKHYDSRQDGSRLVIVETEPAKGNPSNEFLNDIASVAKYFPAP